MKSQRCQFSPSAAAMLLGAPAFAQLSGRPVRLVVGFPAGGGVDVIPRPRGPHGPGARAAHIVDNKPAERS